MPSYFFDQMKSLKKKLVGVALERRDAIHARATHAMTSAQLTVPPFYVYEQLHAVGVGGRGGWPVK